MSQFESSQIRNIAVVGHGDAGKTTFVSALLYYTGAIKRFLSVDEGNTITDYDEDEVKRKISISTGICSTVWKKSKLNLLDTPGYSDFLCDAFPALRIADIGAFIVNTTSQNVDANFERIWETDTGLPLARVILFNKLDRENTLFSKTLDLYRGGISNRIIPIALPAGKDAAFTGLIDIVHMKYLKYDDTGSGKFTTQDIPANLASEVDDYRLMLIEAIAEVDDSLLEKYLEGGEIDSAEIQKALKQGVLEGKVHPAIPISAVKNIGVSFFVDFCLDFCPSPADVLPVKSDTGLIHCDPSGPMVSQVFKTIMDPYTGKISVFRVFRGVLRPDATYKNTTKGESEKFTNAFYLQGKSQIPAEEIVAGDIAASSKLRETGTGDTICDNDVQVILPAIKYPRPLISYAFMPATKSDEEKISASLTRIAEEDPTLLYERNAETNELLVSGMGQLHLEVAQERLKRKFGVTANMKTPKIPYKETIKGSADVRYRHKKQTGGAGQFGEVAIKLTSLPRGGGFEFVDGIVGGVVPNQYIPSVEKGVRSFMQSGVLAGYRVVDIQVTLYDGKSHPVDSKDIAFQIAGLMAMKDAWAKAKPILLEPIMKVRIIVPEADMGTVIGDLNSKRGRVLGMESLGRKQVILASVPMAEMLMYEPSLRSMTGGRGSYLMEFDHYEELPALLTDAVVAAYKKEKEE